MSVENEIRALIYKGKLLSFNGLPPSDCEIVTEIQRAEELAFSQELSDEYECWSDQCELNSAASYSNPNSKIPNDPYLLVSAWLGAWEERNFNPFLDEIATNLARIIRSARSFGTLEPFWKRVFDIYMCGAFPCGLKNDGTFCVLWETKWPKVDEDLSPLQEKRFELNRKKALERVGQLESLPG